MKITQVTYERLTKHRVDQYENERASCTVELNGGDPAEAFAIAQHEVEKQLGLLPSDDEVSWAKQVLRKVGMCGL